MQKNVQKIKNIFDKVLVGDLLLLYKMKIYKKIHRLKYLGKFCCVLYPFLMRHKCFTNNTEKARRVVQLF